MDTLLFTIVTPKRQVLQTPARWVDIPAESGMMRALPQHAPTLGVLGEGTVRYETDGGEEKSVKVAGGFLEVLADSVMLLADSAE